MMDETDDDEAMRALLKRAVVEEPVGAPKGPSLLPGVQRKIRQRSKGKFFSDGWSTSQTRVSYVVVALVMLIILGVAYVALGPVGFRAR